MWLGGVWGTEWRGEQQKNNGQRHRLLWPRGPRTLQRFLSLGFNSMLPACHSDLCSAPVIRTAFKAGPKQQSCLRGGGGGGVGGEWRCGAVGGTGRGGT